MTTNDLPHVRESTSVAAPGAKRILVVDDDQDFLYLVRLILAEGRDFEVQCVQTGTEALEAVRSQPPDLVILDLMLPDMNGWEVFMGLRAEPGSATTPVIILSSQGTRHDRSFGLQVAQVHDYLTKPCLPSRLRRSVASALGAASPDPQAA